MRSPAFTVTIARFHVDSVAWRRVPRIVRRPPFMFAVRTLRTCTPNTVSTAFLISGLVAFESTSRCTG